MADTFRTVMSLFDTIDGLTNYLANRIIQIANSIPKNQKIVKNGGKIIKMNSKILLIIQLIYEQK